MTAYMNGFNQYQNNQVTTASREQILIMLYDGAIRFVRQAMEAIEAGESKVKMEKIDRAMAIVSEFRSTLDHEVGGEIAANLDALYDFMLREMISANARNDIGKLKVVEGLLCELRETWMQAIEKVRKENQGQEQGEQKAVNASL